MKVFKKTFLNWKIILIILCIATMFAAIRMMYLGTPFKVHTGKVDLTSKDFKQNELVELNGEWEFYWDRLLTPKDFSAEKKPQMDSLMKVPGGWKARNKVYTGKGIATYRITLKYPATIKDPAIYMKRVSEAYKLYANGQLIEEVGKVSAKASLFKADYRPNIVDLPKDKQELELIIQVANFDYPRGGIKENPVFGSKEILEHEKMVLSSIQLIFVGSVFVFCIYYLLLFILQKKNKTALLFSILCFITALRSLIFGGVIILILFPKLSLNFLMYINYITAYNMVPVIILFILSLYPLDYKRKVLGLILLPNLFFEIILFTPIEFMSLFNNYLAILMLLQLIYVLAILIKAIIKRQDNAILMFIAIAIFTLTIVGDIFHSMGISGMDGAYMFIYGNFAVIIAMSYAQARHQANAHKRLVFYNEKLLEADMLKDKIMETEMSFLQAQIKPHFLYNALSAIANVCEKDGKKAGRLIIDLAVYLRGSLEFNQIDKMVTIEKELELVNTYFHIEQARFGQKIQLLEEINVPLDCQIPILIIQPLVENAVRHGISKKKAGGKVVVRIKQMQEGVSIEIEDDGVGIEEGKVNTLLSGNNKSKGVGFLNIHHRLLRLYGSGLEISSKVSEGTCVRLVIKEDSEGGK